MVNNLTEGKSLKLLFFFATPMVVENLLQQFYNMVDSMVVGRFVREDALAAVGSSFPVVFLSVAITAGMSMGCTVVTSQLFEAGKILEVKTVAPTALISLGVVGLIIVGIGEIVAGPLPILPGADPDIMVDSPVYLRIYFGGAVFPFLYNSLNGIHNVLGDSQTLLKFLTVSALTSIALDLLFVIQFNVGVAGMAWVALIAQGMCAVFSSSVLIACLRKLESEEASRRKAFTFFDKSSAERVAKVGVPSMFRQSTVSISMMLMQGLVNPCGKVFVTGYTAATKTDTLAMMSNMNLSNAMSNYVVQNIRARRMDRVK